MSAMTIRSRQFGVDELLAVGDPLIEDSAQEPAFLEPAPAHHENESRYRPRNRHAKTPPSRLNCAQEWPEARRLVRRNLSCRTRERNETHRACEPNELLTPGESSGALALLCWMHCRAGDDRGRWADSDPRAGVVSAPGNQSSGSQGHVKRRAPRPPQSTAQQPGVRRPTQTERKQRSPGSAPTC